MPSDVRFAEIQRHVRKFGWVLDRVRGSHHVFKKPDGGIFPVPVHHGKVKYQYWRDIQKAIEEAADRN